MARYQATYKTTFTPRYSRNALPIFCSINRGYEGKQAQYTEGILFCKKRCLITSKKHSSFCQFFCISVFARHRLNCAHFARFLMALVILCLLCKFFFCWTVGEKMLFLKCQSSVTMISKHHVFQLNSLQINSINLHLSLIKIPCLFQIPLHVKIL